MSLTKALVIFVLLVAAFNLFFYARFRRMMAEIRRRAADQQDSHMIASDSKEAE